MTARESISKERLDALRTMELGVIVPQSANWSTGTRRQAGRWLCLVAPVIRQLLAEISRLAAELVDMKAVLAKTVDNYEAALGLDDGEPFIAWRAQLGTIALGTYLDREDAQANCEDHYRNARGVEARLGWYEEEPDDIAALRLYATNGGDEAETAYVVVPVPVLPDYDPEAES